MRANLARLIVLAVLTGIIPESFGNGWVVICHIPPGNPDNAHTIGVKHAALRAHLAHGDFEGACECESDIPCNEDEVCLAGVCIECLSDGDCDDGDPCTNGSCDAAGVHLGDRVC